MKKSDTLKRTYLYYIIAVIAVGLLVSVCIIWVIYDAFTWAEGESITGIVKENYGTWGMDNWPLHIGLSAYIPNLPKEFLRNGITVTCNVQKRVAAGSEGTSTVSDYTIEVSNCKQR